MSPDFDQKLRELKTARAKALVTERSADLAESLQAEIDALLGRPILERAVVAPVEVRAEPVAKVAKGRK